MNYFDGIAICKGICVGLAPLLPVALYWALKDVKKCFEDF